MFYGVKFILGSGDSPLTRDDYVRHTPASLHPHYNLHRMPECAKPATLRAKPATMRSQAATLCAEAATLVPRLQPYVPMLQPYVPMLQPYVPRLQPYVPRQVLVAKQCGKGSLYLLPLTTTY